MPKDNKSIKTSMNKLDDIVAWFEEQDDVDVEEGLKKVEAGSVLVRDLKGRLKKVENKFEDLKQEMEKD